MAITTHLCRGNHRSSWVASGGYDFVADALFNQLNVDGFFMEFDDDRSGGFAPLRLRPAGQVRRARSGDHASGASWSRRTTSSGASRRRRKYVDIDQLCLSPQCGFSSTLDGNALTREQQVAKLRLVVEVADEVWG